MIDDSFIKPTARASKGLQESWARTSVDGFLKNQGVAMVVSKAKSLLRDSSSGVYYEPLWDDTLSFDNLSKRVLDSETEAMKVFSLIKQERQKAIDELVKIFFTRATATENVDQSIAQGFPTSKIDTRGKRAKDNLDSIRKMLLTYASYWAVADAYTMEIKTRATNDLLIDEAIGKGDVNELKALKSKVKVKELKTKIDNAIDDIKKKEEAEAQAKKEAEAKQKAIEEANKKLSGATTPEEKAAAQAELDALLMVGGNGGSKTTLGGNKTLLYVGIGVVVLVGAFFAFRKRN